MVFLFQFLVRKELMHLISTITTNINRLCPIHTSGNEVMLLAVLLRGFTSANSACDVVFHDLCMVGAMVGAHASRMPWVKRRLASQNTLHSRNASLLLC